MCQAPGSTVFIYGLFCNGDNSRSAGDRQFDARLKEPDPAIGYTSDAFITGQALPAGLDHEATHAMPANNLVLVLKKSS